MPPKKSKGIPTVTVVIAARGPVAQFPIKVDPRMNLTQLRDAVWTLYHQYIQEGMTIDPPSPYPADYDVQPSFSDGAPNDDYPPLVDPSRGGDTIRMQIQHLPTPLFLSMHIGALWLERDAMLRDEAGTRQRLAQQHNAVMKMVQTADEVAREKATALAKAREAAEASTDALEGALLRTACKAVADWERTEAACRHFNGMLQRWETVAAPTLLKLFEENTRQKRMVLQSSRLVVETVASSTEVE
jgi:hypothetical protein